MAEKAKPTVEATVREIRRRTRKKYTEKHRELAELFPSGRARITDRQFRGLLQLPSLSRVTGQYDPG